MQQPTLTHDFTGKLVTGVVVPISVEFLASELPLDERHLVGKHLCFQTRLVRPAVATDKFDLDAFLAA